MRTSLLVDSTTLWLDCGEAGCEGKGASVHGMPWEKHSSDAETAANAHFHARLLHRSQGSMTGRLTEL